MATLNSDYRPICRRTAHSRIKLITELGEIYENTNIFFRENIQYYKPFFSIMEDIVIPSNEEDYANKNRPRLLEKIPAILIKDLNESVSMKTTEVIEKHSEFYGFILEILSLPLNKVSDFRGIFLEDFVHYAGPSLPKKHDEYIKFMSPVIQVGTPLKKLKNKENDIDVIFVNVGENSEILEVEAIECKSSINSFMYAVKRYVETETSNGKRDYNKVLYMKDVLEHSKADIPDCTIGFATYESRFNIDYLIDIEEHYTHEIFEFIRKNTKIIERSQLLRLVM
ncbi:hypothetical protein [Exiguobacterium sp. s138]|uniref:hypothetical protein n=1 Tax=Exiguobacterium sp. s138 TaxID=2751202 RepID=UPI001BE5DFB2|nr:hypothetical protein [Exiguobacterium sp. s138]